MGIPMADVEVFTGELRGRATLEGERAKVGVYVSQAVQAMNAACGHLSEGMRHLAANDLRVAREALNRAIRTVRA